MKTALITGASSGLGKEFARLFAADGVQIILTARSEQALKDLASELTLQYKISAWVVVTDLSQANGYEKIIEFIKSESLSIDYLVNNAGIGLGGNFVDQSLTEIHTLMQLDMTSLINLTHALLPGMLTKKSGKILNVSSIAAFQPGPGMAVYYAAKAFVQSFSEALASELADTNITVTILCPGPVETGFQHQAKLDNARLFKSGVAKADFVAKKGYDAMKANKGVIIAGFKNSLMVTMGRFVPNSFKIRIAKYLNH